MSIPSDKENEKRSGSESCSGSCFTNNLEGVITNNKREDQFLPSIQQYLTSISTTLGYNSKTKFIWQRLLPKSIAIPEYKASPNSKKRAILNIEVIN